MASIRPVVLALPRQQFNFHQGWITNTLSSLGEFGISGLRRTAAESNNNIRLVILFIG